MPLTKSISFLMMILSILFLFSCSGWAPVEERTNNGKGGYHIVKKGENLFRIAWRYGLDYRDIARWNQLASPDRILAGQRLSLSPRGVPGRAVVASSTARTTKPTRNAKLSNRQTTYSTAKSVQSRSSKSRPRGTGKWQWPARGDIVTTYNPKVPGGKGIQIGGKPGQDVKAASGGEIVYKGSGLSGYGQLVIVKHSESLLSAYGYLGRIFVNEGDQVSPGQVIAQMDDDTSSRPVLHFEVRRNGRPVNPMRYLSS